MIKRARAKRLCDIRVHDLRKFSNDKHKKVDDRPYGGGPGMVLKAEPIIRALESLLKPSNSKSKILNSKQVRNSKSKTKIILFSAGGKQFDAKMAAEWAKKYGRIVMIAGHYEGVDERVKKVVSDFARPPASSLAGEVGRGFRPPASEFARRRSRAGISDLSIGSYVLTGGELPALVVVDAVSRHIPGFLGKGESLEEKRHGIGVPVYTRPEVFRWKGKAYSVPAILRSGDHKKIEEWRAKNKPEPRDVV